MAKIKVSAEEENIHVWARKIAKDINEGQIIDNMVPLQFEGEDMQYLENMLTRFISQNVDSLRNTGKELARKDLFSDASFQEMISFVEEGCESSAVIISGIEHQWVLDEENLKENIQQSLDDAANDIVSPGKFEYEGRLSSPGLGKQAGTS